MSDSERSPLVTINPHVAAGQPVVGSARVIDVQHRLDAGDPVSTVARAFDLKPWEVSALNRPEWRRLVLGGPE